MGLTIENFFLSASVDVSGLLMTHGGDAAAAHTRLVPCFGEAVVCKMLLELCCFSTQLSLQLRDQPKPANPQPV